MSNFLLISQWLPLSRYIFPSPNLTFPIPHDLLPSSLFHSLYPLLSLYSQFTTEFLSISPSQGHSCMYFLGSSLEVQFSGVVNSRLVILYFMSKIHLWVNKYHVYFSASGLPHSGIQECFHQFVCKFPDVIYFKLLSSSPMCTYMTLSLPILLLRGN